MGTVNRIDGPILVTGTAGFIGFNLAKRLLDSGYKVIGYDIVNDYYDVNLKRARLKILSDNDRYTHFENDLTDAATLNNLFAKYQFQVVVNLAAQAGVRYSLINPRAYQLSNLEGFFNIIEASRHHGVKHLVFASSSSVYGLNKKLPFSIHHNVDHPVSLYAASKKANELLAHSYAQMFALPSTGLRFFTVYGPWGRPDMALFLFAKGILAGEPIQLFNHGEMSRDFTYIDDIVDGIFRVMHTFPEPNPHWDPLQPDPGSSPAPYRVYNIGSGRPVQLRHYLELIEEYLGKKAIVELLPIQLGDVPNTWADISDLTRDTGYQPTTFVEEGIKRFIEWYLQFYGGK